MKNIKRVFLMLFVSIFAVFCFTPSVKTASAATLKSITVHYYRYNNDYQHFGWFWTSTSKGQAQMMTTTSDFGRKATFTIPTGCENDEFGLLFCFTQDRVAGQWGGAQTSDFYFTKDNLTNIDATGNAHVYYIQAEDYLCFTEADARAKMKDKFVYLSFDGARTIKYTPSRGKVTDLKIYADGNQIQATDNGSNHFTISSDLDFSKTYEVDCKVNGTAVRQTVTYDSLYATKTWDDAYGYDGELGALYTPTETTFKLWAPISHSVTLKLYNYGHPTDFGTTEYPGDDAPFETVELVKGDKGVWSATVPGDLDGKYYTYTVRNTSNTAIPVDEIVDPYAKSTGVNGLRGMIVNLSADNEKLNPEGWASSERGHGGQNVDNVIYEMHVRDLTAHSSWGGEPKYAGTFLGLAQKGTKYEKDGVVVSTGLDHIIEMGVNTVHLLPIMDSENVDETKLNDEEYKNLDEDGIYNWNYMTANFFTLDGGYSTNPYDGYARMNEFKQLVQTFHENGINVVMDVVFNHTSVASTSNFHKIIPYYYHRAEEGALTNGSGCGNEMASENYMVNKLVVDSCAYFAEEFKVDGFRFDLMALEDTNTMNELYDAVSEFVENPLIYGEPWNAGASPNTYTPANKANMKLMPNIGAFSDTSRDGVRGENNTVSWSGWIFGANDNQQFDKTIFGITGGIEGLHNSASSGFTFLSPNQVINYASCHDNYTLFDQVSIRGGSFLKDAESRMQATTQAISIMVTSQGVPFIEAGSELGRTKGKYPSNYSIAADRGQRVHNSYNLGDKYNAINWEWKVNNLAHCKSIAKLVKIRTNHEAFRQTNYTDVRSVMQKNTTMWYNNGSLIGYQLNDSGDTWSEIIVLHSNSGGVSPFQLPQASNSQGWEIVYSNTGDNRVGLYKKSNSVINVGQNETVILVGNVYEKDPNEGNDDQNQEIVYDNPLVSSYDTYVQYGLSQLYMYDQATQQAIIEATIKFIDASYNSQAELDAAYKELKAAVNKATAGK